MTERVKLAVYGTLKSNHANHTILGESAKVIANNIRLPGFTMYEAGWYPGVVRDPEGMGVVVEVVEVEPGMLRLIDNYEGYHENDHGCSLFVRELVDLPNGEQALMYLYNRKVDNKPDGYFKPVPSGNWDDTYDEKSKVLS